MLASNVFMKGNDSLALLVCIGKIGSFLFLVLITYNDSLALLVYIYRQKWLALVFSVYGPQ